MSVFSLKGEAYVKSLGGKARLRKKSSISVLPHSRVSPETGIAPSLYPSPSFACPLSAIPQHPLSPSLHSGATVLPARSKSYGLTSPKTACFPSASSCPHMAGNSQDSPPIGFGGGSDAEPGLSGELGLPSRAGPSGSAEVRDPQRILSSPAPVDKVPKRRHARRSNQREATAVSQSAAPLNAVTSLALPSLAERSASDPVPHTDQGFSGQGLTPPIGSSTLPLGQPLPGLQQPAPGLQQQLLLQQLAALLLPQWQGPQPSQPSWHSAAPTPPGFIPQALGLTAPQPGWAGSPSAYPPGFTPQGQAPITVQSPVPPPSLGGAGVRYPTAGPPSRADTSRPSYASSAYESDECVSAAEDSDGESQDQQFWSFSDALSCLAVLSPSSVGEPVQTRATCLSAAELALGSRPTPPSARSSLRESPMVADCVQKALDEIRGINREETSPPPNPASGEVPDFQAAKGVGAFLKAERSPFLRGSKKRPRLAHSAIPTASLRLSQEDTLLLPEKDRPSGSSSKRSASISDNSLSDWEEIARRGMETSSVMDSFLGGLVDALKDPAEDGFQLRRDLDQSSIQCVIQTLAKGLRFTAASFARLHLNAVLARRDSILQASKLASGSSTRSSFRVLPAKDGHLFGPHVQALQDRVAKQKQDNLLLNSSHSGQAVKRPQSGSHAFAGSWSSSGPPPAKVKRGGYKPRGQGHGHRSRQAPFQHRGQPKSGGPAKKTQPQ
eukprot:TRINITY_DN2118_c0_g1_i8.p3 TRINITY_DN2118_c0_g1~~TRINITY_DN2118_c0_g1_i8.p3  ORF type:complete len:725 (-),score=84.24 TRINITY_DN2118_c0_g1_i8:3056-5230(-)